MNYSIINPLYTQFLSDFSVTYQYPGIDFKAEKVPQSAGNLSCPAFMLCRYQGKLTGRYQITSNRESGFGRYDVMPEPLRKSDNAMILEFKVQDTDEESLADAAQNALRQIEGKKVLITGSPDT